MIPSKAVEVDIAAANILFLKSLVPHLFPSFSTCVATLDISRKNISLYCKMSQVMHYFEAHR